MVKEQDQLTWCLCLDVGHRGWPHKVALGLDEYQRQTSSYGRTIFGIIQRLLTDLLQIFHPLLVLGLGSGSTWSWKDGEALELQLDTGRNDASRNILQQAETSDSREVDGVKKEKRRRRDGWRSG